jgi:hypothetical protein
VPEISAQGVEADERERESPFAVLDAGGANEFNHVAAKILHCGKKTPLGYVQATENKKIIFESAAVLWRAPGAYYQQLR